MFGIFVRLFYSVQAVRFVDDVLEEFVVFANRLQSLLHATHARLVLGTVLITIKDFR